MAKIFLWKDESGRGATCKMNLEDMKRESDELSEKYTVEEGEDEDDQDEEDNNEPTLYEWAINAEQGDERQEHGCKYICIEG